MNDGEAGFYILRKKDDTESSFKYSTLNTAVSAFVSSHEKLVFWVKVCRIRSCKRRSRRTVDLDQSLLIEANNVNFKTYFKFFWNDLVILAPTIVCIIRTGLKHRRAIDSCQESCHRIRRYFELSSYNSTTATSHMCISLALAVT